jgi:hypothetical protein
MEGAQHADARTLIDRGSGAVGGVGSASGQASGPQLGCGDTITVSTKLMKDLVNCPNNGVVIGADNITFDLNGHVIDGDDAEFADCPPDEACDIGVLDFDHHGVTIKGGKVRQFTFGALVVGASDSRLSGLDLSHHFFSGLLLAESSHSVVDRISATGNGLTTDQAGVDIFDSHHLTLARNNVFANGDIGFFVSGLDDGRFVGNRIAHHPETGNPPRPRERERLQSQPLLERPRRDRRLRRREHRRRKLALRPE